MGDAFTAVCVDNDESGFTYGVRRLNHSDLPEGEVTIAVHWSSINYKDALALTAAGQVVRKYPMVPGIDLAGAVIESRDSRFQRGDRVLVTGYDLGVAHFGGFSTVARVPADWVLPIPQGLDERTSMILGTAGFTAGLAVRQLELMGLRSGQGPVLVTGATGGVGSVAILLLSRLGYEVTASTGKAEARAYLRALGASAVIDREETGTPSSRPLGKQTWAGAIDPVGGDTLAATLQSIRYGGSVALMGLTGGAKVSTTVFPFILRGVNLLGIDSVLCPMRVREEVWSMLSQSLSPDLLEQIVAEEITLGSVPERAQEVLSGRVRGRLLVRM